VEPSQGVGEGSRREEKKAFHRRRILESAREVFFRDGFVVANLDEVAQRAEVAKGTLYRYFANKAELYVAVLAHNGQIFEEKLRGTLDPSFSPSDQIRRTARFYFEHWTTNVEYFQIFWALENQAVIGELGDDAVREITRLWESCLGVLEGVIERGVKEGEFAPCDAWEAANLLWTVANGMIQSERATPRRQIRRRPLAESFEHAMELLLRGLAAHPGA
jgi:TetR/AcrR family fatty acid metabolism transcriptional regulator